MLDHHANKSLHTTKRSAVDHDWPMWCIVSTDVGKTKSLWQIVVNLNGSQLPLSPQTIIDHEVNLGSVECRFAFFFGEGLAQRFGCFSTSLFCQVPVRRIANVFVTVGITLANTYGIIFHTHGAKHNFDQLDTADQFIGKLFLSHKQVSVVLSESAHARQTTDLAGLLPTIHGSKFSQPQRQVAIAALL